MARKRRIPKQRNAPLHPDAPLVYKENHKRPVTRRDFLAQGLLSGAAVVTAPTIFSLFANPRSAMAALSPDLEPLKGPCGLAVAGAGKIPFIAFDLAGGANICCSNVLVGQQGGQLDFLSTQAYAKMGLPGDQIPPIVNPATNTNDFIDQTLGLAFHTDSAFLRGMMTRISPAAAANINGAVIPARSDNDTGNNPHNPMYGIAKAGSDGELMTLIGSENTVSGGNSDSPIMMIDPTLRPTKIDRTSDVTGLVDTGELVGTLGQADATAVMESIYRVSDQKLSNVDTKLSNDQVVKDMVRCGYLQSADLSDRFGNPSALNPELDTNIVGAAGSGAIFETNEFQNERQFSKTAAVMKLVMNGYAGAGTIEMGGYDYHGDGRATAEIRDFRAGTCMGACLEYAHRLQVPLMLYVLSDGSVDSDNENVDNSADGRGKFDWNSDNSSTAASFFLVYNPAGRSQLFSGDSLAPEMHQQIGWFRRDGSVETASSPAANNVNLLVETVVLNYMALHGEQGLFQNVFPAHGLGSAALIDSLTAFDPIVNGTI